jgi:hypothetical protein
MDSKYQEEYIACFIIFGLLIAFSVFMLKQYFYTSERSLEVINAAILFWTGIIILIYTRETYKLREAAHKQIEVAQRQTEIQQRPFVIFEVVRMQNVGYQGKLKNIGNGTAFNIKIAEAIVVKSMDYDSGIYIDIYQILYTQVGSIIETRGESMVYGNDLQISWTKEGYGNQDKLWMLCPPESGTWYKTRIEFQNIEMQGYYVEQATSPKGIHILDSGRLQRD